MFSVRLALTTALLGSSLLPSAFGFTPGFPYGIKKVRGVNLGGWLLLEVSFAYPHNHPRSSA